MGCASLTQRDASSKEKGVKLLIHSPNGTSDIRLGSQSSKSLHSPNITTYFCLLKGPSLSPHPLDPVGISLPSNPTLSSPRSDLRMPSAEFKGLLIQGLLIKVCSRSSFFPLPFFPPMQLNAAP